MCMREDDYNSLRQRITECGLDPKTYDWYLDLRKYMVQFLTVVLVSGLNVWYS